MAGMAGGGALGMAGGLGGLGGSEALLPLLMLSSTIGGLPRKSGRPTPNTGNNLMGQLMLMRRLGMFNAGGGQGVQTNPNTQTGEGGSGGGGGEGLIGTLPLLQRGTGLPFDPSRF